MGSVKDTLLAIEEATVRKNQTVQIGAEEAYPPLKERMQDFKRIPKKAAFGWVGGKSLLADRIISEFPEHKSYVEVFGGALNILYRKERVKVEVVNDIYAELINLHLAIKHRPQSLQQYLNRMLISREIFYKLLKKQLLPRNDIERAAFYYYRLQLSFGAKGGNFAIHKKHRSPKNIYRSFKVWHDRLKGVCIENMDFQKLLESYDTEETLFYLDPPYVGTESYYEGSKQGNFTIVEHERLANALYKVKGKFALSYNDCEVVRHLYRAYNVKQLHTSYGMCAHKRVQAEELLITNF
jgi:DNA adenine methylase